MSGRIRIMMPAFAVMVTLACLAKSGQRMTGQEWNPHTGPPAGAKYVGENVCAGCHVQEAEDFLKTPMAQAGKLAANAKVLQEHPQLKLTMGPFRYLIVREGNKSIYSVTDGKKTIAAPILWGFGDDVSGQTYMLRYDGAYYQSRVSFFNRLNGLAVTYGAPPTLPQTLEEAFGERLAKDDAQSCIACHATGAVVGGVLHAESSVPGVRCEACHGPGDRHVSALHEGKPAARLIFNPARLSPYELDEFCGSCHRTWEQIERSQMFDIRNVRFQPYRLEKSKCWDATDPRISCLACHNPHKPLVEAAGFYDSKCLACHLEKGTAKRTGRPGPACPVAAHNCITCHMPKFDLPGAHFEFTDHDIRVVQSGAPYPG
jgi:Cytochrome c554 and c-prime